MFAKDGVVTGAPSTKTDHSIRLVLASSRRHWAIGGALKPSALAILILLAVSVSGCLATALATGAASLSSGATKGTKPAAAPATSAAPKVQNVTNAAVASQHPEATPLQAPASKDDLRPIRQKLAAGDYSQAHSDLELITRNSNQLSQAERRELKDDLCLTEYLIGQASYPSLQQQRTCSAALSEQGSVSGAILARIHDSIRQSATDDVKRALKAQDLASAEGAALAYTTSLGADPDLIAGWSEDFWRVVHDKPRPTGREQRIAPVIAQLANEYPQVKSMSENEFLRLIVAEATVSGKSVLSRVVLLGDSLDLMVAQGDLDLAATHLYKFVRINDIFAARCGCDARTNLGLAAPGFPAYLFRLDEEESASKVLLALGEPETAAGIAPAARVPSGEPTDQRNAAKVMAGSYISPATDQNLGVTSKPSQSSASAGNVAGLGGVSERSIPGSAALGKAPTTGEAPRSGASPERRNSQPSLTPPTQGPTGKVEPNGPASSSSPRAQVHTSKFEDRGYPNAHPWAVTVYKSSHELTLDRNARPFKRYTAVFGSGPGSGPKMWENDHRTPEGTYTIAAKYPDRRWKYFLLLNYPNGEDRIRYRKLREVRAGEAPNQMVPREGGSIGIHGTDRPRLNEQKINWTAGCISVDNRAISELYRVLPVGATVLVKP